MHAQVPSTHDGGGELVDSSESCGAAEAKFLGSMAERSGHSSPTQPKLSVEALPQAQPATNIRPQLPLLQLAHGADVPRRERQATYPAPGP